MITDTFADNDSISIEFDLPDGVPAGTFTAALLGPIQNDSVLAILPDTPSLAMVATPRTSPAGITVSLAAPSTRRSRGVYAIDLKDSNGGAISHVKLPAFIRIRVGA